MIMDSFQYPTFLSQSVRHIVVEIGMLYQGKTENVEQHYVNDNCTLNWEEINTALSLSEKINMQDQSPVWFSDMVHKIWPIFVEAHLVVINVVSARYQKPVSDHIIKYFEWTTEPKNLLEYLNSFVNGLVSINETILFLTSVLERSLGNLYLLKGVNVPSLLRDLLATGEISLILGITPVIFLQLILGTPLALNLRNLVWHGFPSPEELHPHFASVLFLIFLSIGEILSMKDMDLCSITKRAPMHYPSTLFSDTFPSIKHHYSKTLELLFQNELIPQSHHLFWEQSMQHYVNGKYGQALIILLPQLEHMLRCLFCRVNQCSSRCLTAESVVLYTTMTEILGKHFLDNEEREVENKLVSFLGESIMEILFDLFVHPEGPRVRDKMSHGECHISDIPEMLLNHVFCISVIIVAKSRELSDSKTSMKDVLENSECGKEIFNSFQLYKTKFHPVTFVKMSIKSCVTSLDDWNLNCLMEDDLSLDSTELSSILRQLNNKIPRNGFSKSDSVVSYLSALQVATILRPKSESEVVKLLRQVVEIVEVIIVQVKENLEMKHQQYKLHLLRSRNRDTYLRMLTVLPNIKDMLFDIMIIIVMTLEKVNLVDNLPQRELNQLLKFYRVILQYVQNVLSWTKQDKNRWLEISTITVKICNYIMDSEVFIFQNKN